MLELPECTILAAQLRQTVLHKPVQTVVVGASPHKFAFMADDGHAYPALLGDAVFTGARQLGGFVQLDADSVTLLLGDGVNLRYHTADEQHPTKHQLYLGFADGSALVCSVQMYGGMWAFTPGGFESPYYQAAREKPSPLGDAFTLQYFTQLREDGKLSLSAKAFLATEQRIPGLGNGVLQDILFTAGIHPQRKIETLGDGEMEALYHSIVNILAAMVEGGGRDTEKDLYGNEGGYHTLLSAKTCKAPCPKCGAPIVKKAYLGGSVYFCPVCQPL